MQRSPRESPTAHRVPETARNVMHVDQVRWRLAIAGVVGAEASLIAMAFGWVAIYSYFVNPGQPFAVYDRSRKLPYLMALVLSVPVFFFTCRWIGLRAPSSAQATALTVFGLYCLIDIPLTLASPSPFATPWFMAINGSWRSIAALN
jgi:hypothetical protein